MEMTTADGRAQERVSLDDAIEKVRDAWACRYFRDLQVKRRDGQMLEQQRTGAKQRGNQITMDFVEQRRAV
jgi:hypothetical protein